MANPLLSVHCQHEHYCKYPVALRVAMDDGTVQTYVLQNKTELQFQKVMESLQELKVGYQYKPTKKNRRNR